MVKHTTFSSFSSSFSSSFCPSRLSKLCSKSAVWGKWVIEQTSKNVLIGGGGGWLPTVCPHCNHFWLLLFSCWWTAGSPSTSRRWRRGWPERRPAPASDSRKGPPPSSSFTADTLPRPMSPMCLPVMVTTTNSSKKVGKIQQTKAIASLIDSWSPRRFQRCYCVLLLSLSLFLLLLGIKSRMQNGKLNYSNGKLDETFTAARLFFSSFQGLKAL